MRAGGPVQTTAKKNRCACIFFFLFEHIQRQMKVLPIEIASIELVLPLLYVLLYSWSMSLLTNYSVILLHKCGSWEG